MSHPFHVTPMGEEGPPILLLHGLGTTGFTWNPWLPGLAQDHQVFVLDFLGSGKARKPRDGRYSPEGQSSLLLEWIRRKGLRDLTLVGHSLGGTIALLTTLDLLAQDPGCVSRLVILSGVVYPQPISPFIRLLAKPHLGPLALWLLPSRPLIRIALRRAHHPSRPVDDRSVDAYVQSLRGTGGRRALSRSAAGLLTSDPGLLARRLPSLDLPCLLIWGDQDRVVPLWVGQRLASELPIARLVVLQQCGHMVQEEASEESLEHVRQFLDETY